MRGLENPGMKDMDNRFRYHPPTTDDIREAHEEVRDLMHSCAIEVEALTPDCRERSLAITKLEESMFWANAAIARNQ
jgi:hypothetical protein